MSETEDTRKPDVPPQKPSSQKPSSQKPSSQKPSSQKQPLQSQSQPEKFGRYWTGAHTKHRLRYHLVWIPKYRKRVLKGQVAVRLEALLRQACEVNGWEAQELAIQPDHVHLLVQVQARDSVPGVMKVLKGGTSRVLRAEFPDLEEYLWGKSFWAEGYFAETVGAVEGEAVQRYIREQRAL